MSVVGKEALETTILSSASQAFRDIGNVSFCAAELVRLYCKRWSVCSNVVKPPLVCWSCDVRRFVGFPCGPFHWFALVVRLGRSHERCVRRHCYVLKFGVFVWEIVGSGKFTVARLAMISRQLPARPQSALSVSQLATSCSVCCERRVIDASCSATERVRCHCSQSQS